MSTDRVEVNPDTTPNPSIEEQAKQQTVNATSENDTNVEVSSVDNTNKSTDETRPSWLPEKFSNAEELAKAYSALERKQSQPQEPEQQEAQGHRAPRVGLRLPVQGAPDSYGRGCLPGRLA